MPIYAYKCSACGHAQDVLQKMSDPILTVCPNCGQSTYAKQVTAAAFKLKGTGWYVTDFRDNGGKPPPAGDAVAPSHSSSSSDAAPAGSSGNTSTASDASSAAKPAPVTSGGATASSSAAASKTT